MLLHVEVEVLKLEVGGPRLDRSASALLSRFEVNFDRGWVFESRVLNRGRL